MNSLEDIIKEYYKCDAVMDFKLIKPELSHLGILYSIYYEKDELRYFIIKEDIRDMKINISLGINPKDIFDSSRLMYKDTKFTKDDFGNYEKYTKYKSFYDWVDTFTF